MLNLILGKTGDSAYESLDACYAEIRKYLEDDLEENGKSYKMYAIYDALCEMATFKSIPKKLVTQYIDEWFESRIEYIEYVKEVNPTYYEYYFGTGQLTRDKIASVYGYGSDYMTVLAEEADEYIRQEMVFRYIVQVKEITLTEEDYSYWDEEYIKLYGEDYAEGATDEEIRDQFLREKVNKILFETAKSRGNVTYT